MGDSCALCLFWRLRSCETSSLWEFILIVVDGETVASCSHVISLSYGMFWVERNLKDHLLSISSPWAGTFYTRPGCPKPHLIQPSALSGMRHSQILWANCSTDSPPSQYRITEYPRLKSNHRDYPVQLLPLYKTTPRITPYA